MSWMGMSGRLTPACRTVIRCPCASNTREFWLSGGMVGWARGRSRWGRAQAEASRPAARSPAAERTRARRIRPASVERPLEGGKALISSPFIDRASPQVQSQAPGSIRSMAAPTDARNQLKFLVRNAAEVVPEPELALKLER